MKRLIINADDFGYRVLFNKSILELMGNEKLLSVSVLVDRITPDQENQVKQLKKYHRQMDVAVGLHTEFTNNNFRPQIENQYQKFGEIFGFEPDHIDIHKEIYLPDGYPEVMKFAKEKNIPCKNHNIDGVEVISTIDPIYDITGKSMDEIEQWLRSLTENRVYSIQSHPGIYDPECTSSFNEIREVDVQNIIEINKLLLELDIKQTNFKHLK